MVHVVPAAINRRSPLTVLLRALFLYKKVLNIMMNLIFLLLQIVQNGATRGIIVYLLKICNHQAAAKPFHSYY